MKELPVDFFSFTEIGGVGEMIYTAVRFPEYVVETDEDANEVVVPLFSGMQPPIAGNDYSLTGQDLLAGLCNLYQKLNNPESTLHIAEAVRGWCKDNVYPFDNDELTELLESDRYAHIKMWDIIKNDATFRLDYFLKQLCNLGSVFEFNYALKQAKFSNNAEYARALYYEGRLCDGLPFLEKYRNIKDDPEYLEAIKKDYNKLMFNLIDMFPDFKMRLKINKRTHKIEYGADIHSVFDIAWYAFARMIADVAPPADTDPDEMFSQGSILTCMACGEYFVRHGSRQKYCMRWECQAERNRRNRRASYARTKSQK